jgi:hypothetical protein
MKDVCHIKMFLIAVAIAIPAAAWAVPQPDPHHCDGQNSHDDALCAGHAVDYVCHTGWTCEAEVKCTCNEGNGGLQCGPATPINNVPCDGAEDNNACTAYRCNGGQCMNKNVDCNDNDACTNDSCNPTSGCVNSPVVCPNADPCKVASCNPADGSCATTNLPRDCGNLTCGPSPSGCYECGDACLELCDPVITFCPNDTRVECMSGVGANTLVTASASCGVVTSDGLDSYDFTCDGDNSHVVTYTATGDAGNTATCQATLTVEDTAKPTGVTCGDSTTVKTSEQGGLCSASLTPSASGTDACEGHLTGTCDPAELSLNAPGKTTAKCTVADCSGNAADPCSQSLTLIDDTPPTITCPTPYVTPPLAPMSWTAASSVTDNCGSVTPAVTSVDCYLINGAGKKVSKLAACKATYSGNTVSVGPSAGGVGTIIQWTVSATDGSGNTSTKTCSTQVQNPGLTK